ncbi:sec1 family domain-containing protein 2-like [Ambystoma mexicanum]|uniref:sec1 family domain-containing protein 2-like n=1 Tax=Ambystoma mexicanum TaxID=8296 RepID=UPI0037E8EBF5
MSTQLSPSAACTQAWERVLPRVRGALVFLDAASAESLHWCMGGVEALLRSGALAVRALDGPAGSPRQPKAVMTVVGQPKGAVLDSLRELVLGSYFQNCLLLLTGGQEEGLRLEDQLRRWMGEDNSVAEVVHVALGWAPLAPQLLLSPALASFFPPLPADLQRLAGRPRTDRKRPATPATETELPAHLQLRARSLARALSTFLEELGLREECFAMGALSRIVAVELAADPQGKSRRKVAPHRGSLLLIDRSLDLTGAVSHHGDNLVEKIISVLPRFPGHTNDVAVNVVELTALLVGDDSSSALAPGCLAQPNDPAAKALWESMLSMKHKEAVMEVRRHLVEAASRENLPIKMSMGRVTPEQLSTYVQLFKNNLKALENHCGLLQLGLATSQTLKHPEYAKWDNFLAFERLLLQNLGETDLPKVLRQLLSMVKSHSERKENDYSPEDLLVLLVYIYSVVGEIPLDKELDAAEEELKKALVRVFCDEPKLSPLLQKITGTIS